MVFDYYNLADIFDAIFDGVHVERFNRVHVDDFSQNAFFGEFSGGVESVAKHVAISDNRNVLAFAGDMCFADNKLCVLVVNNRNSVASEADKSGTVIFGDSAS